MDLFNMALIVIAILSLISWVRMLIDMKKNPIVSKYYDLSNEDICEIKNIIKNMDGRQFEKFCEYLFKQTGRYKEVILTQATHDGGRDVILTTHDGEVIYVECKRYTDQARREEWTIGREILQKLTGAMISNNVKHGIVFTTGNIHQNGWDFINKLEANNPDIKIEIYNMDTIMQMVKEYCDNNIYRYILA